MSFVNFLTVVPPLELLLIFFAKIIDVSIGTFRIILVNKGYRKQGTVLAFIGIMLWVFIASQVLLGLAEAPIKGVVYSAACAIGVYLGSWLEAYIAMGQIMIEVIVSREKSEELSGKLRQKGIEVTIMDAKGRDSDKQILMIFTNRKGREGMIDVIHKFDNSAMIVTNDISARQSGIISIARKLIK